MEPRPDHVRKLTERIQSLLLCLDSFRKELIALAHHLDEPPDLFRRVYERMADPPPEAVEQLLTLDQLAAIVHRSKFTLRHYFERGMPRPRVLGMRGRPHLWAWTEVRPWLETTFGQALPERYPGLPWGA